MIGAGKRDRRVQFLRASVIDGGMRERRGAFIPYGSAVWASKTPISDGERFRADAVARNQTDRFVVRYSALTASIKGTDRLVCEGVTYGIAGLKEIGRREGIEITATRVDDDVSA